MRKNIIVGLVATSLMLGACSRGGDPREQFTEGPTVTAAPTTTRTPQGGPTGPMPTVREAPEIPAGVAEDAAAATAQTFLEQWVQFTPGALDPKEQWFSTWEHMVTREFRNQMRVQADGMWSWTWNTEQKACCVAFPAPAEAHVGDEQAVAKVTLTRWVLPLFATAGEMETITRENTPEKKTYLVWLDLEDEGFLVTGVDEIPEDAPLPEVR